MLEEDPQPELLDAKPVDDDLPFEVQDDDVEVDFSKLINLNVSFEPLQLSLQRILKRVRILEGENQVKTIQIKDLQDTIAKLQQQQEAAAAEKDDLGAIWQELERLSSLLGNLQGTERRPTIAELFYARQERDRSPLSSAGSHRQPQGPNGEAILVKAKEALLVSYEGEAENEENVEEQGETDEDGVEREDKGSQKNRLESGEAQEEKKDEEIDEAEGKEMSEKDRGDKDGRGSAEEKGSGEKVQKPEHSGKEQQEDDAPFTNLSGSESKTGGKPRTPQSAEERKADGLQAFDKTSPTTRRSSRRMSDSRAKSASAGDRQGQSAMSFPSHLGGSQVSVSEKLKRDSDDIAYLNRVVAEILADMKGIHGDVDVLRTLNGINSESGVSEDELLHQFTETQKELPNAAHECEDGEEVEEGDGTESEGESKSGLGGSEGQVGEKSQGKPPLGPREKKHDKKLGNKAGGDSIRDNLRRVQALNDRDVEAIKGLSDDKQKMKDLERAVNALEKANERMRDKVENLMDTPGGSAEVTPLQYKMLSNTVKSLEKELDELHKSGAKDVSADLDSLKKLMDNLKDQVNEVNQRSEKDSRVTKRLEEKLQSRVGFSPDGSPAGSMQGAALQISDELWGKLEELHDRLRLMEDELKRLEDERVDRNALQKLRDDLQNLKRLVEMYEKREASRLSAEAEGADSTEAKTLLLELQGQVVEQMQSAHSDKEEMREEVSNVLELVRQLDHRKADATLVANKAERDYVENALERLMREVEQVLNATNGGLIDTLDKSLNILRDMIDAKASKQDIARLQQLMEEEGGNKAAADGLMGFKGYRCLGCNRPVDSLRSRTMPTSIDPFLNRNPQTYPRDGVTRTIQQQQQAIAPLEQRHAIQ